MFISLILNYINFKPLNIIILSCFMKNKQGSNKRCFYKNEIYSVVLKLIILSKLKKQNPYAYNILTDLKRNSMMKKHFSLTEEKLKNDTYNTIKSLETSGYIKLISSKKNKKYYEVTKQGDEVLSSIKKIFVKTAREIQEIIGK